MKLRFKHQKFQADAAKAVVDVFAGQPYLRPSYMMDRGSGYYQKSLTEEEDFTGWSNQKIVPELNDRLILDHIQTIQGANQIKPSMKLEGRFNLTIEMETGVGKTYVDSNYINIYDFDKHTLDYKYDKTGFEHLSNEEFKSIPGRKIKENWFELYMADWCKIIDSNKYDVVTGWLQDDAIEYLLNKGYELELILVDAKNYENVYKERSVQRGNNENYWNNLKHYYNSTLEKYKDRKDMKITIFTKPFYLSEYLLFSGTILKRTNRFGHSYITKTKELVEKEFKTQNEYLLPIFTSFYSQLVLTSLASNQEITKEMVHEAWSIAIDNDNPDKIHSSLIPFEYLSDYIQDLDQYYVEKLTNVLEYLKELKLVINHTRK